MKPWLAALILAMIMSVAIVCYFFRIPEDLRRIGKAGRWGPPNAEFNWCEPDYLMVDWMAEPVNTISNVATILSSAVFLYLHEATWDNAIIAGLQVAIGIGSVFFHASLRYPMQLADELPMLWYSLMCAASYLRRLHGVQLTWLFALYGAVVASAILLTEQRTSMHEVWRGIMSASFALCMVVVGWGSSAIVTRIKQEVIGKRRHIATTAARVHLAGYVLFVASLLCWLFDNYFCPALHHLPGGLPYPHLHMWWHILTAAALYVVLIIFHLDDRRSSEKLSVRFWAWLPIVVG